MNKLKTLAIAFVALIGVSTAANAAEVFLATDDFVGISFWLISMGMLAATAFFFMAVSYTHLTLPTTPYV